MCKNLLCLLCAIFLIGACASSVANAEVDWITLNDQLLSIAERTDEEWYDTDITRTTLAVFTAYDCILSGPVEYQDILLSAVAEDAIYVAKSDGNILFIFFFGSKDGIGFIYQPSTNTLEASSLSMTAKSASYYMQRGLNEDVFVSYHQVDASSFIELTTEIKEMLQK